MNLSDTQITCDHQLIFSDTLDHAASCALCGAIIILSASAQDDEALDAQWIQTSDEFTSENNGD
jgi:hypothetical protein